LALEKDCFLVNTGQSSFQDLSVKRLQQSMVGQESTRFYTLCLALKTSNVGKFGFFLPNDLAEITCNFIFVTESMK